MVAGLTVVVSLGGEIWTSLDKDNQQKYYEGFLARVTLFILFFGRTGHKKRRHIRGGWQWLHASVAVELHIVHTEGIAQLHDNRQALAKLHSLVSSINFTTSLGCVNDQERNDDETVMATLH